MGELMHADLHRVIRLQKNLDDEHAKYFVYQILLAVQYIHSADLVHRDIKPANVLCNKNCDAKLADFGLARAGKAPTPGSTGVTDYVQTRYWRAPEIILLPSEYDEKVDLWSVECTLAELMTRRPIFVGHDHVDQIRKIFDVLGTPSENEL